MDGAGIQESYNLILATAEIPTPLKATRAIQYQHTVGMVLRLWQEDIRERVKPATYSTYAYQVGHTLLPKLGDCAAGEFGRAAMAGFLAGCREEGLSESTLSILESILRQAFALAVRQGILRESPFDKKQTRPKQDAGPSALSPAQVAGLKVSLAIKSPAARLEILLPLYTGCILSELCALSWREVDLGQGELLVRKNLQRVKEDRPGSRARTALKLSELSPAQQRVVHIPEFLCGELASHMENLGNTSGQVDRLYLLTGTGDYPDPRTYQKHVRATLAGCGIPDGSLTMLRDTYVAMCLEKGAGEYSLAMQLGIEPERLLARYREYLQPDYGFVGRLE